jgi:FlaA1/EpsC-like NDP-sugar epimerase
MESATPMTTEFAGKTALITGAGHSSGDQLAPLIVQNIGGNPQRRSAWTAPLPGEDPV